MFENAEIKSAYTRADALRDRRERGVSATKGSGYRVLARRTAPAWRIPA
jgi:hypothetical protein